MNCCSLNDSEKDYERQTSRNRSTGSSRAVKILSELITSNSASFAKATEGNLRSTSGQRKNAGWIARTTHKSEHG
jgi:hypothetical protein